MAKARSDDPVKAIILVLALLAAPLSSEKSRYLREHADNPVQWQPWGAPAFAKAKREGKPIFLSIGYASCHWCHVMESESFENKEIAALINNNFVPILVDREEHPDVDAAYMGFVQAMTGNGGWPANLVLTPELQPIVGATFLRPEQLSNLLTVVSARWRDDRATLLESSEQLIAMVKSLEPAVVPVDEKITEKVLQHAYQQIVDSYDAANGGFSAAPKFPQPGTLDFLLRYAARTGSAKAREMALTTLVKMSEGAVYDQLGGGFHRYAIDDAWRVPHFEKMLPDQALLAIVLVEAWQMTGDTRFEKLARATLDHALREMRQSSGTFDSGLDSDSVDPSTGKMVEGAFYLWDRAKLVQLLGGETAAIVADHFGVPNEGKSALALRSSAHNEVLDRAIAKMRDARSRRPPPARDDKALTGWNGLMVSALARAGAAFDEPRYVDAATQAARSLRAANFDKTGQLLRTRDKEALSEDYAYFIGGLLDLYESTFDVKWLDLAIKLQQQHDKRFWREKEQRYDAGGSVPSALMSIARENDMTQPSHNSAAAMNLLRLADITDNEAWRKRAEVMFRSFAGPLQSSPADLPQMAAALARQLSTGKQIVIAGNPRSSDTRALLRVVNRRFIPNRVLLLASGGEEQAALAKHVPFVERMSPIGNRATAYICEHYVCKMPTNDLAQVRKILEQ